jgi:3-oxoacyl-(acyl-carrier-protein) synthase
MVRDALGFSGSITIVSNACASGSNAIGHAWELDSLRGQTQRALAGGYDALSALVFSGFDDFAIALDLPSAVRSMPSATAWRLVKAQLSLALESLEHANRRMRGHLG